MIHPDPRMIILEEFRQTSSVFLTITNSLFSSLLTQRNLIEGVERTVCFAPLERSIRMMDPPMLRPP